MASDEEEPYSAAGAHEDREPLMMDAARRFGPRSAVRTASFSPPASPPSPSARMDRLPGQAPPSPMARPGGLLSRSLPQLVGRPLPPPLAADESPMRKEWVHSRDVALEYHTSDGTILDAARPVYLGLMVASFGMPGKPPPEGLQSEVDGRFRLASSGSLCQHLGVALTEAAEVQLRAEVEGLRAKLAKLKARRNGSAEGGQRSEERGAGQAIVAIYCEIVQAIARAEDAARTGQEPAVVAATANASDSWESLGLDHAKQRRYRNMYRWHSRWAELMHQVLRANAEYSCHMKKRVRALKLHKLLSVKHVPARRWCCGSAKGEAAVHGHHQQVSRNSCSLSLPFAAFPRCRIVCGFLCRTLTKRCCDVQLGPESEKKLWLSDGGSTQLMTRRGFRRALRDASVVSAQQRFFLCLSLRYNRLIRAHVKRMLRPPAIQVVLGPTFSVVATDNEMLENPAFKMLPAHKIANCAYGYALSLQARKLAEEDGVSWAEAMQKLRRASDLTESLASSMAGNVVGQSAERAAEAWGQEKFSDEDSLLDSDPVVRFNFLESLRTLSLLGAGGKQTGVGGAAGQQGRRLGDDCEDAVTMACTMQVVSCKLEKVEDSITLLRACVSQCISDDTPAVFDEESVLACAVQAHLWTSYVQTVFGRFRVLVYLQMVAVLASATISPNLHNYLPFLVLADSVAVASVLLFLWFSIRHGLLTSNSLLM